MMVVVVDGFVGELVVFGSIGWCLLVVVGALLVIFGPLPYDVLPPPTLSSFWHPLLSVVFNS